MTIGIIGVASNVQVNDPFYNGTGTNRHPTFAWESVSEVRQEDGLILLITGNSKGPQGEFWLDSDEQIELIRHPESITVESQPTQAKTKHGHK